MRMVRTSNPGGGSAGETVVCPQCGRTPIDTEIHSQRFRYGEGDEAVELVASVPVRRCVSCGFEYLDEKAETARHEAVCRHLRVLSPREIVHLRTQYGFSRADLARLTRLGEATIARWERGELIQNAANDSYLRLLAYADNVTRLKGLTGGPASPPVERSGTSAMPRFRSLPDPESLRPQQRAFQLRARSA